MADAQGPELELARFLRARRERLRPEDVGFPAAGRRRTPGLRREEVAVLAGVSTTWYTYLEQGRGKEVSPAVLDSVARVLQLNEDERRHVHILAYGQILTREPLVGDLPGDELVKLLVKSVDNSSYPVYGANFYCDLIAWNRAAVEWYDDWSAMPPQERNIFRWAVTSPIARERFVDWPATVRDGIARWRAMTPSSPPDKRLLKLISELSDLSSEFASFWNEYQVLEHRTGIRVLRHPKHGVQPLRIIVVESPEFTPSFVVFHAPANQD
jgi:transcriptional regulator with XRE-family HTH domain